MKTNLKKLSKGSSIQVKVQKQKAGNNENFKILTWLLTFSLLLISVEMLSQAFMPAYAPDFGYKKGYVVLNDSSKIEGTFIILYDEKNIKNCTVKDSEGTKHKLGGDSIDKVFIIFTQWDKMNTMSESIVSLETLVKADFNQVFNADYFIWEHVITPKKGKRKILQLVNPGFDSKIKVYRDPFAQKTGIDTEGGTAITGGVEKSYFVVKKGTDTAIRVRMKTYSKQFEQLFGDCPELMNIFKGGNPDWNDFPAHMFVYDQAKN